MPKRRSSSPGDHCLKGTSTMRPDTIVSTSVDSYAVDMNPLGPRYVDPTSVDSEMDPTLVSSDPEEDPSSVDLTTEESSSKSPVWQQKRDRSIPIASRVERRMKGVKKDARPLRPLPWIYRKYWEWRIKLVSWPLSMLAGKSVGPVVCCPVGGCRGQAVWFTAPYTTPSYLHWGEGTAVGPGPNGRRVSIYHRRMNTLPPTASLSPLNERDPPQNHGHPPTPLRHRGPPHENVSSWSNA